VESIFEPAGCVFFGVSEWNEGMCFSISDKSDDDPSVSDGSVAFLRFLIGNFLFGESAEGFLALTLLLGGTCTMGLSLGGSGGMTPDKDTGLVLMCGDVVLEAGVVKAGAGGPGFCQEDFSRTQARTGGGSENVFNGLIFAPGVGLFFWALNVCTC